MKLKLKELANKIITTLKPYKNTIIIPLLKIILVIVVCILIVHFMSGNETLLEYESKKLK